jgi:hypothetical protein
VLIVLSPPVLDDDLGFEQRAERLQVEQLVAQPGVERLDVPVLPRAARVDEPRVTPGVGEPRPHGVRGELAAVVRAEARGPAAAAAAAAVTAAAGREQSGERVDDVVG